MNIPLTPDGVKRIYQQSVLELCEEPEYQFLPGKSPYTLDDKDMPAVKAAAGNFPLDYDLWEGLRNPAMVGLHPVGFREIWEFYQNRMKDQYDESGRRTAFKVPRPWEYALKNFGRAVMISVMLPFSNVIVKDYVRTFQGDALIGSSVFAKMVDNVNRLVDGALNRLAVELMTEDRVVVAMTRKTVDDVSCESVPATQQGDAHGPCKGGNYPQKSVAAMLGLGQFGISRLIFRDELVNGNVVRFFGPVRSIIVFDREEPVRDGRDGILHPSPAWREFLISLFDFTNVDPETNRYRFCTYAPFKDKGCGQCVTACPSGAQSHSGPGPDGTYPEHVVDRKQRFWDGRLQFDYDRCASRAQMGGMYQEWRCLRCGAVCTAAGLRRRDAVTDFEEIKSRLAKGEGA